MLRYHILRVRLQVAAGVWLPQVPDCVGSVVPLSCVLLACFTI